jgi:hypothetical protein
MRRVGLRSYEGRGKAMKKTWILAAVMVAALVCAGCGVRIVDRPNVALGAGQAADTYERDVIECNFQTIMTYPYLTVDERANRLVRQCLEGRGYKTQPGKMEGPEWIWQWNMPDK